MQILVVDDSAFARERIAYVLREAGHTVIEAASGQEALALCAESVPDVITVDLLMPEMDGMELVRRLHAQYPSLPIIVVSADVQRATRDEALATGALAFVAKVGSPAEILEAVHKVVGRRPLGLLTPAQHDAFTEMMNVAVWGRQPRR